MKELVVEDYEWYDRTIGKRVRGTVTVTQDDNGDIKVDRTPLKILSV